MVNYGLLTIYIFTALSLGVNIAEHGQLKTGKENVFYGLIAKILSLVLIWWALNWQFI